MNNKKNGTPLVEEIGDVQIMLDQLRIIFCCRTADVEEEKLARLVDRIAQRRGAACHE